MEPLPRNKLRHDRRSDSYSEQPEAQTPEAREEADIRAAAETNPEKFEKFGGVDAFLKSYQDLRADHTKKSQELSELKNSEPAAEEQQEAAPADAPDSLEIPENVTEYTEDEAAEMWDEWGQELRSSGDLSDDTRSTIREKLGIPEEVINAYVKGLQAQAQTRAGRGQRAGWRGGGAAGDHPVGQQGLAGR